MLKMIKVHIMGETYKVPEGLTIVGAMEYSGFVFKRGVGCREGFCGACATVYRKEKDYRIYTGLACQTVIENGMYIAQIPFVPAEKAIYDINSLEASVGTFEEYYPSLFRCVSCNTCTKACPQDIQVMDYVNALERGDIALAADLSFDCIRCGLCALRCPAEIVQYNAAIMARRLYAKYLAPKAKQLQKRLEEINQGSFEKEINELMALDRKTLSEKYYKREIKLK